MTQKTRLKLFAGMAVAALGLSACATTELQDISTPPVEPKMTSSKPIQKQVTVPARAFAYDTEGNKTELVGVPCKLRSDKFHMSYQTPANVKLPVYGIETSELDLSCTYEGAEKYTTVGVRNLTMERIASSGNQNGLLGALLASGIAAGRGNRPNDDYSYRPPSFTLNEKPQ